MKKIVIYEMSCEESEILEQHLKKNGFHTKIYDNKVDVIMNYYKGSERVGVQTSRDGLQLRTLNKGLQQIIDTFLESSETSS